MRLARCNLVGAETVRVLIFLFLGPAWLLDTAARFQFTFCSQLVQGAVTRGLNLCDVAHSRRRRSSFRWGAGMRNELPAEIAQWHCRSFDVATRHIRSRSRCGPSSPAWPIPSSTSLSIGARHLPWLCATPGRAHDTPV